MKSLSELYGADYLAARFVGRRKPGSTRYVTWQHGWIFRPTGEKIFDIVGTEFPSQHHQFLVAREAERAAMADFGFDAKAAGLPFCYTSSPEEKREPGSILVVPVHDSKLSRRLDDSTLVSFRDYVSQVLNSFDCDADVLTHWEDSLEYENQAFWGKIGAQLVAGANPYSHTTLQDLRETFSKYEYVVVQSYTSAIPYALYSGAKVSVWPDTKPTMWQSNEKAGSPETATDERELSELREGAGWLFQWPTASVPNTSWGASQIGEDYKLTPSELKKCLGWTTLGSAKRSLKLVKGATRRVIHLGFR